MVHNLPPVYKRANAPGTSGNSYKHTGILNIAAAAAAANVTVPPQTWQFDWSDQLALKQDLAEKGQANGYAALDGAGQVPDAQLPASIARDAEVAAAQAAAETYADGAVADHAAAADPHTGYQRESEKGQAGGYAALDGGGKLAQEVDAAKLTSGTLPAARFNDTAHGNRGGSSLHANAVASGAAGFMTGADKAKLDGIESGATADQSAAEILTAVKTVDGAGSGLDADLLDGLHASALQTRSEKGAASGYAGLDASGRVVAPAALGTAPLAVTSTTAVPNLNADQVDGKHAGGASGLATLDAGGKLSENVDAAKLTSGILPAARFNDTAHGNRGGGSLHAGAVAGGAAGFMSGADKSKLDGVEAGATADQSAAEILAAVKTVDGAGSGLDADLLDGVQAASFLRSDANDESTGRQVFRGGSHAFDATGSRGAIEVRGPDATAPALLALHRPGAFAAYLGLDTDNQLKLGGWSLGAAAYKLWSENNDGAGSGLDADLLDGQHASELGAPVGRSVLTGSGTYTVPAGVYLLDLLLVGGGGGGSGYDGALDVHYGSGGGGASWLRRLVPVTPGQQFSYAVGAGGTGAMGPGQAGGNTTFGSYTAYGGNGGGNNAGGVGAAWSRWAERNDGAKVGAPSKPTEWAAGASAGAFVSWSGGGGGGSSVGQGGSGGDGGNPASNGNSGSVPGGGGGGAGYHGGGVDRIGGNGAAGTIEIIAFH